MKNGRDPMEDPEVTQLLSVWIVILLTEAIPMPLVPHFPSDEPSEDESVPDFDDVVDRILNGGDDPTPSPTPAGA